MIDTGIQHVAIGDEPKGWAAEDLGGPGGVSGWHLAAERPLAYEAGVEELDGGGRGAFLRSISDPGQGLRT